MKIRTYHALRYKFHEFFIHFLVDVLQFGQAAEKYRNVVFYVLQKTFNNLLVIC